MTDDYYSRFLPQMRKEVMLGIDEIGAASRYHSDRWEGEPPEFDDPFEIFNKYRSGSNSGSGTNASTIDALQQRIKALEDKYQN